MVAASQLYAFVRRFHGVLEIVKYKGCILSKLGLLKQVVRMDLSSLPLTIHSLSCIKWMEVNEAHTLMPTCMDFHGYGTFAISIHMFMTLPVRANISSFLTLLLNKVSLVKLKPLSVKYTFVVPVARV